MTMAADARAWPFKPRRIHHRTHWVCWQVSLCVRESVCVCESVCVKVSVGELVCNNEHTDPPN